MYDGMVSIPLAFQLRMGVDRARFLQPLPTVCIVRIYLKHSGGDTQDVGSKATTGEYLDIAITIGC